MSIFYLLPPRPLLGDYFAAFLQTFFPGMDWDCLERLNLADLLGDTARTRTGVYVVYRDELPPGESPTAALVHGFGAEPGDEVIDVRPGRPGEMTTRRWRVSASDFRPKEAQVV
jgi:hypothetical protein